MNKSFFVSLDSSWLASKISRAKRYVCYVAPGILEKPANALAGLTHRIEPNPIEPEFITVHLDFSEHTIRMGFGDLKAVETLQNAGIEVGHTSGLRTGLVIIDDNDGYVFTPTALYVEAEVSGDAPNAVRLSREQILDALSRLSLTTKVRAIASAKTEEEQEQIREQPVEMPSKTVADDEISEVKQQFQEAPLLRHDLSRQVRSYSAHMQYVEIELKGTAIQRRTIPIPKSIQGLGGGKNIDGRLKTTFDLIKKDGSFSSKKFEDEMRQIRKDFTPQLGKGRDRVVLKARKQNLEKRLNDLEENLQKHKEQIKNALQKELDKSKKAVVDYYLPIVRKNPPEALIGGTLGLKPSDNERQKWLELELDAVFPKAESLVKGMELNIRYKDVTYESLNDARFIESVKNAFPYVDWQKLYDESVAAGQKTDAEV